jgi:hypothetical protein
MRRGASGAEFVEHSLATPRVLLMARRHFGCTEAPANRSKGCTEHDAAGCLDGVPLEDCLGSSDCSSGEGTKSSHFEHSKMYGELMVGTSQLGQTTAISALTLAVFEDSGWFVPNYEVGSLRCLANASWCEEAPTAGVASRPPREEFVWGRGRGCGFLTEDCSGEAWRAEGYFCEERSGTLAAEQCTAGRLAAGRCTLTRHAAPIVPSFYRYFADDSRLGGNAMEDFCPLVAPHSDWNCRVTPRPTAGSTDHVAQAAEDQGESRGAHSRCFESTLLRSTTHSSLAYNGCYERRCLSPTQLQIRVAGSWYAARSRFTYDLDAVHI